MANRESHFYVQQLWSVALKEAINDGYYFGDRCEIDFKAELRKAVFRMIRENTIDQSKTFSLAKENTRRLINEMIVIVAKTNQRKRLREFSLKEALKKLCPLQPFC